MIALDCGTDGTHDDSRAWTVKLPMPLESAPAGAADLALSTRDVWLAHTVQVDETSQVRVRQIHVSTADSSTNGNLQASFEGRAPRLLLTPAAELLVAYIATDEHGYEAAFVRVASPQSLRDAKPRRISPRLVEPASRLAILYSQSGDFFVAAVHADTSTPNLVIYATTQADGVWAPRGALRVPEVADPELGELDAETLLLVFRTGNDLLQCLSQDRGATWSEPELAIAAVAPLPFSLTTLTIHTPALVGDDTQGDMGVAHDARDVARAFLTWTAPRQDSTHTPPTWQALRFASLAARPPVTAARAEELRWSTPRTLTLRPGATLYAPRIVQAHDHIGWLYHVTSPSEHTLVCQIEPRSRFTARLAPPSGQRTSGRYGIDPVRAREAMRLLALHTLQRQQPANYLFAEAYFMRSLVEAYRVLSTAADTDTSYARAMLDRALAFADTLVQTQSVLGYWHLGYSALNIADMGATTALFINLDPFATDAERQAWLGATESFVRAIERDGLVLRSGAFGMGWRAPLEAVLDAHSRGQRIQNVRQPYAVSTALAGVELHAWLFHHRGDPAYRDRAMAALDFTLSQVLPNGSVPSYGANEGALHSAAYIQEGWMAAAALLDEEMVLQRLCDVLPRHVDWLLRQQHADGTWDGGAEGEFARTPAILNFLIWYDHHCEPRADVKRAVQRAAEAWVDLDSWEGRGVFRSDEHREVLRAILGRVLAALATEQSVR